MDPIIESCITSENEVTSHIDGELDIGKPVANTFGFMTKTPLQV